MKKQSAPRNVSLAGSARQLLQSSRRYVRKHPWQAAGIAAATAGAAAAVTWAVRGAASPQIALPLLDDDASPRTRKTPRAAASISV